MTWRDVLKVHPAADMFPMMSEDEIKALALDIKTNSLKSPIAVWSPDPIFFRWVRRRGKRKPPPEFYLVDGRNRLAALEQCERLEFDEAGWPSIDSGFDYDSAFTILGHLDDPYEYVVSANIHRRHLTGEQRRDLITKLLKADPDKSDRQIAAVVKVDHKTVGAVRKEAEGRGEIPHVENRTDTKGRAQPTRKQRVKKKRPTVYIEHADGRREPFTVTEPIALFTACGMPANNVARAAQPTRLDEKKAEVAEQAAVVTARWRRTDDVATIARCVLAALKYEPHTEDITSLKSVIENFISAAGADGRIPPFLDRKDAP